MIEKLLQENCLDNLRNLEPSDYAKELFSDIEKELRTACSSNRIQNFSVEVVSAIHDNGTRNVLIDILNKYEEQIQLINN